MSNQTALVPMAYQSIAGSPQASLQFIDTIGTAFFKGGLVGCKTEGQGKMLALTCLCEGITPLEFARTYHLIDGKPVMRADAMLAKFKAAGGKIKWLNIGDDGKEAKANFTYEGESYDISFTMQDARRMGVVKDKSGWEKDPGAMLRAALIRKSIRIVATEIVAGFDTPDELLIQEVMETQHTNGKAPRGRKAASSAPEITTQVPAAIPAEDADFDIVSTAEAPFGEPDTNGGAETAESFVEEEAGAADSLSTKDGQPHAVIEDGTIRSSDTGKADPAIIAEIKELVGANPELREAGKAALQAYGVNAVRSLNDVQSRAVLDYLQTQNEIGELTRSDPTLKYVADSFIGSYKVESVAHLEARASKQLLALLLTHKAGLADKLPKVLSGMGCANVTELSAEQADTLIAWLRKKITEAAQPQLSGAAAGN